MIGWLDATAAKDFGAATARFYIERIPVDTPSSGKKFASRSKDVLSKLELRIAQFKDGHKLNTYKKAKAGTAFKWTLRDAGYEAAYVDRLTEWFITKL
jgi:hypothetical protein